MLDLILKLVDRLVALLREHRRHKADQFAGLVEPTFSDLVLVHRDYLKAHEAIDEYVKADNLEVIAKKVRPIMGTSMISCFPQEK